MAVEFDGITIPASTGAVETPSGPVTTEQVPGHPESTGAVTGASEPVVTEFGPTGEEPAQNVPNPGPWTASAGGFIKVVRSPRREAAAAQSQAETSGSAPSAPDQR